VVISHRMNILITGIGSIGQRHYKNLKALGHTVAVLRSGRPNSPFIEKFLNEQVEKGDSVIQYSSLDTAVEEFKPEAAFVANPNSCHMDIALPLAKKGLHLFIEKPVTNTMDGLEELQKIAQKKKLKIMVGYNLRWHPQLTKMHEMVKSGKIGEVLSAHVDMGEYMPDWHPWEDYRDTYAPYKDGGGGVVLCFSHDIDYLYWFLGMPTTVYAVGGKMTPLEGDAEDMIKALCEFPGGAIATIHLDYWQRPKRRLFELVGAEGKLIWHYDSGTLTYLSRVEGEEEVVHTISKDFDRNDTFIGEAKEFIGSIEQDREPSIPLKQGIDVLRFSEMLKEKIGF